MQDLALDPVSRDLSLDDAGRLETVDATEALLQRIRVCVRMQRNQWPFDLSAGVPWRELVTVREPDIVAVSAAVRAALLSVPGVERVNSAALVISDGVLSGTVYVNGIEVEL